MSWSRDRILMGALVVLAGAPLGNRAHAQALSLPNGLYLGADGGVLIPQSINASATAFGVRTQAQINFDAGPAAGVFVGYRINQQFSVEGNFEYAHAGLRSAKVTISVNGAAVASGTEDIQGNLDLYNVFADALWQPFGNAGVGVVPYLGGGIGFSDWNVHLTNVAGTSVSASHSEPDLALNGILGVDFAVTPQLTVGGRYRLLWINTSSALGPGSSTDNFLGHILTANMIYRF